jgi:hypothetical protein
MTAQEGKTCAICGRKLDGRTGYQTQGGLNFCLKHIEDDIFHVIDNQKRRV